MSDQTNRERAIKALDAARYIDSRIPAEAHVLARAALYALLDIADAIRETRTAADAGRNARMIGVTPK